MMQEYYYIYEVYKEHSFSKAAKNLYISQPALSATIKKIEDRLGTQLFERTTTSLSLTEAGKAYINTAIKIISLENDLKTELDDIQNLTTGKLELAGTAFFSSYIIPPIIKDFRNKYPGIKLELADSESLYLYKLAQENNLDLIIDAGTYDTDHFESILLYNEHILLAVPDESIKDEKLKQFSLSASDIINRKHLDSSTVSVNILEFKDQPFLLLKKEHDLYNRAISICRERGFEPNSLIHLNQLMTCFNLTKQGLGVSFVSDSLITTGDPSPNVSYFKIDVTDQSLVKRPVFIAYWKNKHISKAMQRFIDMAKEIYSKWE